MDIENIEEGIFRLSDRLKAVGSLQDVNTWFLVTETDNIVIGQINCIVGESFARGLVEAWNEKLDEETISCRPSTH